jgi:hypothetical protein
VNDKKIVKPTDVVDHLDTNLAQAVSTARRIAKNILPEVFDQIVANFLITTGIKLALNGKSTKAEIQSIVTAVLDSSEEQTSAET